MKLGALIARLDAFVITMPYQWLIDLTQRERVWWIRQCAYVYLLGGGLRWVFGDKADWHTHVSLVFVLLGTFAIYAWADWLCTIAVTEWFKWLRAFLLLTQVLDAVMTTLMLVAGRPCSAHDMLTSLVMLAALSAHYFAACKPPAPPRRRESRDLVLGGGNA